MTREKRKSLLAISGGAGGPLLRVRVGRRRMQEKRKYIKREKGRMPGEMFALA